MSGLWDAVTGAHKRTLKVGSHWAIALSPDGRTLASWWKLCPPMRSSLWDVVVGQAHKQRLLKDIRIYVTSIVFSPDGGTLASASGETNYIEDRDSSIRLWNAVTGAHKQYT